MKNFLPYQVSALNALLLILIGSYGYFQSSTPSPTALIPVGFGVILLAMNKGVKSENSHGVYVMIYVTLMLPLRQHSTQGGRAHIPHSVDA